MTSINNNDAMLPKSFWNANVKMKVKVQIQFDLLFDWMI
jgi:hypothetical protein